MAMASSLVSLLLLLLAADGLCLASDDPNVLASQLAATYNVDILINADLFSNEPAIMSGSLGFTNIIGVSNNTDEAVVRAANGTWRANVTCASGAPPPNRVLTSAAPQTVATQGFNCTANNYDGLPICFSWPVLPSSISKEAILVTLSNGTRLTPVCLGLNPNWEFNERQCLVAFGKFGNRLPSADPGSLFVASVEVPTGSGLQLVGPNGPVSAEGLTFTNPTGKSPYDDGNGPYIMVAKLSQLSESGEGISVPPTAGQDAFPNDGIALYGAYNGTLGESGGRYRLRLFYSGGMTPDGVRALQPTDFANHFYLVANGSAGEVRVQVPGTAYDLGTGVGTILVLGLADTGRWQSSYDECYQEDYDNYIDIIIDASSPAAAAALTTLQAFQTGEGYAPLYNPGGPGNAPTPGVVYSSPSPPQTVPITLALDDPLTVTYCNLNGTVITSAGACSQAVAAMGDTQQDSQPGSPPALPYPEGKWMT